MRVRGACCNVTLLRGHFLVERIVGEQDEQLIDLWWLEKGGMTTVWSKYGDCAPIVHRSASDAIGGGVKHVDDAVKEGPTGGKVGTKLCYGREAFVPSSWMGVQTPNRKSINQSIWPSSIESSILIGRTDAQVVPS